MALLNNMRERNYGFITVTEDNYSLCFFLEAKSMIQIH